MLQVKSGLSAVSLSSSGILLPNEPRLCAGSVWTPSHYALLHFQQPQLNANVPHIYKQRYEARFELQNRKDQQAEEPLGWGMREFGCHTSGAEHGLFKGRNTLGAR